MMQLFGMENERLNQSRERLNSLRLVLNETSAAKEGVTAISNGKKNDRIIVPLGAGVFTEAKLENTKDALVNMPGGIVAYKSLDETQKELSQRIENLEKAIDREAQAFNSMAQNLEGFAAAIRQAQRIGKKPKTGMK